MFHVAIVESIHTNAMDIIKQNKNYSYEIIENIHEDNLIKKLKKCDAIALRTAPLTEKIINSCDNLKIVSRHGVGFDNVDLNTLNLRGIPLTITINANAVTVSEHVLAMMFYFNKKVHLFDNSVRNNKWDEFKIFNNKIITINSELFKKTLVILGFGRIGKELAKRCLAFDMQVLVFDPYVNDQIFIDHNVKRLSTLDEGIAHADFLSIHLPLSDETKNLIDINNLKKMKKNAFVINTSRGGIINENDLNKALDNNIISGAGLDVFTEEPLNYNNLLLKNKKVVLTPHSAALTSECWLRMGQETIRNIIDFFDNNLKNTVVVNKDSIKINELK